MPSTARNLLLAFAVLSSIPSTARNLLLDRHKPISMPPHTYHFWIYILASRSRNLYVGFTNDLIRRLNQHKQKTPGTHTAIYNIHRLVYFERFQYVRAAIARENELKSWTREKKIALIEKVNPTWTDLANHLDL